MKYRFTSIPAVGGDQAAAELDHFLGSHHVAQVERTLVADGARKAEAQATWEATRDFAAPTRNLVLEPPRILRSPQGVPFLGFRVLSGPLHLSRRRRRLYTTVRERWEARYIAGEIDALKLQRGYDVVRAITDHADAAGWRSEQLRRVRTVDA